MTDTAERNRKVKALIGAEFGHNIVRVRGGRGTSHGWLHIYIDKTPLDRDERERWERRCYEIMRNAKVELGKFYVDDGYGTESSRCSIVFEHSRYRQTIKHDDGTMSGLRWDDNEWEKVEA